MDNDQDRNSAAELAEAPTGGEQPAAVGAPTVSQEDFKNLQRLYDQKLDGLAKDKKMLEASVADLKAEISLIAELPKEQAKVLEFQRQLAKKEAVLLQKETQVTEKALRVAAKSLVSEHKVGLDIEELVKLGDETAIELAVLREKSKPVAAAANLPRATQVDQPRGGSTASSGDNPLARAIAGAKTK